LIGKWHLGDTAGHVPNDFDFESFFGTLYSHGMQPLTDALTRAAREFKENSRGWW
jgi:arylsulfatase A-like enzyme